MFDRIITLSLNPSIDVTLWVDEVRPSGDNKVREEKYEAAGKAMNVSRALRMFGMDNLAVVLGGRYNWERYESRLKEEGIRYRFIPVDGYTRENISVVEDDRRVTRYLREGFTVPYEVVEELLIRLEELVSEKSLVVISGSLPKGVNIRLLASICRRIKGLGGLLALDVQAEFSMEDVVEISPWIVKPNLKELSFFAKKELSSLEEIVQCCRELNQSGVEHCLVSMGDHGLVYTGEEGAYRVRVPDVNVVSAVGSGDYCLAGFLMGRATGRGLEQSLRTAAAFGTAACLTDGAEPPTRLATANILEQVRCEKIGTGVLTK